jgi:hypothetical protein
MNLDKKIYKDGKNRLIGMTANPHCTHWQAPRPDLQTKACQRGVQSCQRHMVNDYANK